ncbi:MAG: PD-(D/E)XK nuclease family transposase [Pyrinomonadaceae bacterium]|nr:PD-(D/E)XK nuclease family transposase [Pyrinomonadaceae bacterium]
MLANLDNEVIFKKAFTDKIVFKAFVRDILGIEVEVDKIETEKQFEPRIGYVDFKLDIFAETTDKRIVIEIQRVEYDHNFDRFLHYFLMTIAEQQKRSKAYGIEQTVYVIVVLTAPYKISEKNGKPIKDEVLLMKLNPRDLQGIERDLYGHQIVFLNPNHPNENTPQAIRDWLDLIYQSIYNSERPVLNRENEGINRVVEIISFENLTPEERAESKNQESAIITKKVYETAAREEGREEGREEMIIETVKNGLKANLSMEILAQLTNLNATEIDKIIKRLEK